MGNCDLSRNGKKNTEKCWLWWLKKCSVLRRRYGHLNMRVRFDHRWVCLIWSLIFLFSTKYWMNAGDLTCAKGWKRPTGNLFISPDIAAGLRPVNYRPFWHPTDGAHKRSKQLIYLKTRFFLQQQVQIRQIIKRIHFTFAKLIFWYLNLVHATVKTT